MPIAERTATTTWEGGLARGHGSIRPDSLAFDELPSPGRPAPRRPGARRVPRSLPQRRTRRVS